MCNSADFMRDAKLLLREGSHAHAMGLVVLAEEEFAKFIILGGVACGHLRHPNWLKLAMRRHNLKHLATGLVVAWQTVFSLLGIEPGSDDARELAGRDPADAILWCIDKAVGLMEDADLLQQRLSATDADLRFLGRMQAIREQAFYVGVDVTGQVSHPSHLPPEDALRYFKAAQARADLYAFVTSQEELRRWLPPVSADRTLEDQMRRGEHWLFEENGYKSLLAKLRVPPEGGAPGWVKKTVTTLAQMARDPRFHVAIDATKQVIAQRRGPAPQPQVTRQGVIPEGTAENS